MLLAHCDRAAEKGEAGYEKHKTESGDGQELGPDDIKPSAAEHYGLGERHIVAGRQ